MKKITIIFLAILLVGCSNFSTEQTPSISTIQPPSDTNTIYIEEVSSLNIYSQGTYYIKEDISSWEEYFYLKTGHKLFIQDYIGAEAYNENPTNHIIYKDFYGAIMRTVHHIIDNIELYTLNDYYKKYHWDEFINSKYLPFITKGDDILAIPCIDEVFILPRFYNKTYLEQLQLEVPKTIDELTNFLIEAKPICSEPAPMVINERYFLHQTTDIFRAFNVYPSSINESMMSYNPNTSSYEDAVFAPDFRDVILYLEMLQENKLITCISESGTKYFGNPENLATEYNSIYHYSDPSIIYYGEPTFDYERGYYLLGRNSENLIEIREQLSFFMFPKGIDNIEGTIKLFNDIFTNEEYYYDLRYGIEGKDYWIENDKLLTNGQIDSRKYVDINTIKSFYNDKIMDYPTKTIMSDLPHTMFFEGNLLTDIIPLARSLNISNEDKLNSLWGKSASGTVRAFTDIYDFRSVDEKIEKYQTWFKQIGGCEIIEEINEKIGSKTSYKYN